MVSRALRRILKVDEHWPTELVYLAKEEGGIGQKLRLSDLTYIRKLALVARLDQPVTLGRTLMSSVLEEIFPSPDHLLGKGEGLIFPASEGSGANLALNVDYY